MSPAFIHRAHKSFRKLIGFLGLVILFSPRVDHLAVLLPVSNSKMHAILMAFSRIPSGDSWVVTATVLSSPLLPSGDVFVAIIRLVFGSVERLDCSHSFPSSSTCDSSLGVFVIIRLLMFCAFELLDSSLSSPSTSTLDSSAIELCCVGVSATARLLSIYELPVRNCSRCFHCASFSRSESGGIGTSFDSCGIANSPAALPTSSLLLAFLSTSFAIASFNTSLLRSKRSDPSGVVVRHSSILTRQGVRVGLCSLSRSGRIATRASCSGSESFEIRPGESLRPHSSSLKRHCWWWQFAPPACPQSTFHQHFSTELRSLC